MGASRRLVILLMFVGLITTAASCGSVKVAAGAVDEAARAVGGQFKTVELSGDQIETLARGASVSEDTIREVAPSLDAQGPWQQSVTKARAIGAQFGPPVAEVSLGVACDGLAGDIKTEQDLYVSLAKQVYGLTQSQLQSLATSTRELWQTMYTAHKTGTQQDKATVALACYTVQNV